jgi:hypothetical protein
MLAEHLLNTSESVQREVDQVAQSDAVASLPTDFVDYLCAERGIDRGGALKVLSSLVLARLRARDSTRQNGVAPSNSMESAQGLVHLEPLRRTT